MRLLVLKVTTKPVRLYLQDCLQEPWASQVAPVVKKPSANAGDESDSGSIPELRRSPGVGNGNPLQHSCLKNPMDRKAWWTTVRGVTKSRT